MLQPGPGWDDVSRSFVEDVAKLNKSLCCHHLKEVDPTGKPSYKKNGKKADNVRFGRPPPLNG